MKLREFMLWILCILMRNQKWFLSQSRFCFAIRLRCDGTWTIWTDICLFFFRIFAQPSVLPSFQPQALLYILNPKDSTILIIPFIQFNLFLSSSPTLSHPLSLKVLHFVHFDCIRIERMEMLIKCILWLCLGECTASYTYLRIQYVKCDGPVI